MISPKGKTGFVGIANRIWDEVIRRDFTKRQKDILLFIWRLSYGCRRDVAVIPMLKDFSLCGVGKGHIAAELRQLEQSKVITRDGTEYRFNENYDYWQIAPVRGWDDERFNELIHLNLVEAKKTTRVTKTGTVTAPEQPKEGYQNGDLVGDDGLPKQELDNGCEVTETGTDNENKLLKQESAITETGTQTPLKPLGGAGYSRSKDNLKTIKDKDINIYVARFEEFWSIYPKKVGKKKAQEKFLKLAPKLDFEKVMNGTRNYIAYCKKTSRYFKDGSSFVNQQTWDDFVDGDVSGCDKGSTGFNAVEFLNSLEGE